MATLDWIVLLTCSIGILYCLVTMPKPIISKEEYLKLPENEDTKKDTEGMYLVITFGEGEQNELAPNLSRSIQRD